MKATVAVKQSQLEVLKFIAKYRFVTARHIQNHFNYKSRTSVNNKLKRLVATELVGMRYDNSKKLTGVPAAFYLTPKGLRVIQKQLPYITEAIIRSAYSDKNASESLIQESSELFEQARAFMRNYPDMKVLTARQLGDFEYFPKPLPDLYLAHQLDEETRRFFLFNFRDVKRYDVAVHSCINKLVAYLEDDTYDESGNEFPVVLFVCHSATIERLAQRIMRSALNRSYESMLVYTTSYQALIKQEDADEPIWSNIDDPDELLALPELE
jgi:hypothetical protein